MRIRTFLAVSAGLALLAAGSPAHAAAADDVVNTKVVAAFDRDSAEVGKQVTFNVTVTNTGTVIAHDVKVIHESENDIDWIGPNPEDAPGFDLAPGESRVLSRTGTVAESAFTSGEVFALAYVRSTETENPNDNISSAYIPVPGALSGVLVTAKGVPWPGGGEASTPVPGVRVALSRSVNRVKVPYTERTTGADGTISLINVPAGTYVLDVTAPDGWKVTLRSADVTARQGRVGTASVTLAATGPAPTPTPTPTPTVTPTAATGPTTAPPATGQGGGLALTGANGTLIGGVGLALLVLGGLAFLFTRRRRTSFTSAD
jgi:hypothetical protein